mmetsp:Transcript_3665/g.9071  ORF Transcript_3665/g.9071 Transcript_3665/m.9071 type:complete len:202 (-) Transcript_3665:108-713(-)|eukprot:CAMPEP_0202049646 /NCGR_PEP_ID=MMETSP0963-20130614/3520_1 /ASSEMBLY_ACC=CAM_ASM_000494 /TAXON_ID=4773 /ORGANISM="Schizochytrium aggregatum, Strain ATCC28209" /LENGTH=201 /DNA_ID=CAMNT_0048614675 /DNA_START=55 /DNA_END=660 /DNA_ORIENTATION=-
MWDADADKYWKEKLKAKRQADLKRKIAIGVVLAVLALLGGWVALRGPPLAVAEAAVPNVTSTNAEKTVVAETPVPAKILTSCRDECRLKMIDQCNAACRFAQQEMPRPTVFRACQSPCVQTAHRVCDIATNEAAAIRRQCRLTGDNYSLQVCKPYDTMLPRPRVQQVCKVGTRSANPHGCNIAATCIADKVSELSKSALAT